MESSCPLTRLEAVVPRVVVVVVISNISRRALALVESFALGIVIGMGKLPLLIHQEGDSRHVSEWEFCWRETAQVRRRYKKEAEVAACEEVAVRPKHRVDLNDWLIPVKCTIGGGAGAETVEGKIRCDSEYEARTLAKQWGGFDVSR